MTKWQITINIFNSKVSGKIFTRNELRLIYKTYGINYDLGETCSTYVNTLLRAGYISNEEAGVYRKLKKIPNVSETSMKKSIKVLKR